MNDHPHNTTRHPLDFQLKNYTQEKAPDIEGRYEPKRAQPSADAPIEDQIRGKEEGNQGEQVEGLSTNLQLPEGLALSEASNIVSGYCWGVWDLLEEPDFDAAVAAEMEVVGSGRTMIAAAANARLKENVK